MDPTSPPHLVIRWRIIRLAAVCSREGKSGGGHECANDKYFTMRTMHAQRTARIVRVRAECLLINPRRAWENSRRFTENHSRWHRGLPLNIAPSSVPGLRSLSAITNHGCLGLFGSLSLFPTTLKTPTYNQSWMGGLFRRGVYPCFSLKWTRELVKKQSSSYNHL